jgi:hypothetical protein
LNEVAFHDSFYPWRYRSGSGEATETFYSLRRMGNARRRGSVKGVRWSRAQYQAYLERKGVAAPTTRKKPVAGRTAPRKGKNKTEAEFEMWFKHQHPSLTILYEPLKLRIDATCVYTPDFFCPELLTFFEVKGPYVHEDSVIKFKAARAIHGWAKFSMWQKRLGGWREIRKLPGEVLE